MKIEIEDVKVERPVPSDDGTWRGWEKRAITEVELLTLVADLGALVIPRDKTGNWPMALIDELNRQGFDGWTVQSIIEGVLVDGPNPDPI